MTDQLNSSSSESVPKISAGVSGEERTRCTCVERGLTAHEQGCVVFTLPEAERVPFLFNQDQASPKPGKNWPKIPEDFKAIIPKNGQTIRVVLTDDELEHLGYFGKVRLERNITRTDLDRGDV